MCEEEEEKQAHVWGRYSRTCEDSHTNEVGHNTSYRIVGECNCTDGSYSHTCDRGIGPHV
jgi:hypothetical protein